MLPRSGALLAFFAGLLVLNLLISFLTGAPPNRPRVPYQPVFLEQVDAGNVEAITSREDSIEGELKKPMTYDPPGDNKPVEVDRFKTQVPGFIDRTGLTALLSEREVVQVADSAAPLDRGLERGRPAERPLAVGTF